MQIHSPAFMAAPFPGILPAYGIKASKSPGIQSKKSHFIPCSFLESAAISRSRSNIAHCLTDAYGCRNRKKQLSPNPFQNITGSAHAGGVSPPL